jgi:hypothetical protein
MNLNKNEELNFHLGGTKQHLVLQKKKKKKRAK